MAWTAGLSSPSAGAPTRPTGRRRPSGTATSATRGSWKGSPSSPRNPSASRWRIRPTGSPKWRTWPGPIAHEYDRLRRLLEADQLVASVWQLKDVAEVLIRFPACVMARDILEHGSVRAFQDATRRILLGPAMSMGTWQGLAQGLAAHIVTHDGDGFLAPQVASLFWMKDRSSKREVDGAQPPVRGAGQLAQRVVRSRRLPGRPDRVRGRAEEVP